MRKAERNCSLRGAPNGNPSDQINLSCNLYFGFEGNNPETSSKSIALLRRTGTHEGYTVSKSNVFRRRKYDDIAVANNIFLNPSATD